MKGKASRIYFYHAGLDSELSFSGKKAPSPLAMKALPVHERLVSTLDVISRTITEDDTVYAMCGRNGNVLRSIKHEISKTKPKLGSKVLAMEPSDSELAKHIRLDANGLTVGRAGGSGWMGVCARSCVRTSLRMLVRSITEVIGGARRGEGGAGRGKAGRGGAGRALQSAGWGRSIPVTVTCRS